MFQCKEVKKILELKDLSEISREEEGGVGILNLGSEIRWTLPLSLA